MFDCSLTCGHTIDIADNRRRAHEFLRKQKGFVTRIEWIGDYRLTIRDEDASIWITSSVTTRENANALSIGSEYTCDPLDERCFSGSACSQIPNTNNRTIKSTRPEGPSIV